MSTPSTGQRSSDSDPDSPHAADEESWKGVFRSPNLRLCARRVHNVQASADQLRRRNSAAHRSVAAGGRSSAITSRTPPWSPARGGKVKEAKEPIERIDSANDAARVQPRKAGYFNAVQVFPYSPGALYQIYAAPGQITDIALEAGEQLIGSGPVAAGDTVRWVVGDTESGSGETRRVHIMVKPTRAAIETNLVLNTDRRTYLIELRSREKPYMPSVSWFYPEDRAAARIALSRRSRSFRIQPCGAIDTP